jgi:uncharacterized protein (TIGR03083 family)
MPVDQPVDHLAVIEEEAARLRAAYAADPGGRVPWSDRWSVGTVARHVAGTHHVVAQVVADRPDADFGRFRTLDAPEKGDPGFPDWFAAGTAALISQCRTAPPDEPCWSWHPDGGGSAGFWTRRMAHETLVHRWDAEAGAGVAGPPIDPAVAADGVDEMLDVFVSATRALHQAPAGPAVRLCTTDTDTGTGDGWYLDLSEPGRRTVGTEPIDVALTLRGPAEGLLLFLWGRLDVEAAGVSAEGDRDLLADWTTFVPPM